MITRIRLDGMVCTRCKEAVYTSLTPVEGITRLEVTLGAVVVEHDGRATPEQLREAIEVSGYRVTAIAEDRRRLL